MMRMRSALVRRALSVVRAPAGHEARVDVVLTTPDWLVNSAWNV